MHAPDRRVLFFGDSLVAGVGDPAGVGWVGRVAAASFALDVPLTAYNLGVRGETSEQVAARWLTEAQPRVTAAADPGVVLSFGAVDSSLEAGALCVEPDRSCLALSSILWEAEKMRLRVLMVGPAPVDEPGHNARIATLSSSFATLCWTAGVPFVNAAERLIGSPAWMNEVAAVDGAHPSSDGYDALAQLVLSCGWFDWLRGA